MIGGILFLSCQFLCLFVCLLSTFNIHIWHAYSTNDALSNDTKVNDLVTLTLTLTFALKRAFLDFVAAGGIVSVSQTHLDFYSSHFRGLSHME